MFLSEFLVQFQKSRYLFVVSIEAEKIHDSQRTESSEVNRKFTYNVVNIAASNGLNKLLRRKISHKTELVHWLFFV